MLKAAEYIKKNYYRDLTIDELSEYVKKSPNYFSHLFKKEFGLSFSEYLNRLRVNEAKNLIKNSSMLAYEIAEKVGFQDYKYFVQVFKKVEGYSPSEFRKNKLIE
jgi:two-component system, response regulator YesN